MDYSVLFTVEITVSSFEQAQTITRYLEGERTVQDLESLDRVVSGAVQDGSISYGPGAMILMHHAEGTTRLYSGGK